LKEKQKKLYEIKHRTAGEKFVISFTFRVTVTKINNKTNIFKNKFEKVKFSLPMPQRHIEGGEL
jgi:hypothetical protein